jgi:hypothetical protein
MKWEIWMSHFPWIPIEYAPAGAKGIASTLNAKEWG